MCKYAIEEYVMPSGDTKISEVNEHQKSDSAPFIIYAYLECLIEKRDGYKNNLENSSTTEVNQHIPSSFSISTTLSFESI